MTGVNKSTIRALTITTAFTNTTLVYNDDRRLRAKRHFLVS